MTDPLPPKVSVVCAWFNRADYISDTIDSVLAQDYTNFDLTVVNDGSTDPRVREILDSYDDPRLRVLHQQNTGFTRAIRRAIDESDGEYIAIQGAGDISLPRRLSAQVSALLPDSNILAVAALYSLVEPRSQRVIATPTAPKYIEKELLRRSLPVTQGTYVYKRSAYNAVGGYNSSFQYAQDWEFLSRLCNVGRMVVLQEELYHRYVFEDGATYSPRKRLVQISYGKIARSDMSPQKKQEAVDVINGMDDSYIYQARHIPATIRILLGTIKRRTFHYLPDLMIIMLRQTYSLFLLRI